MPGQKTAEDVSFGQVCASLGSLLYLWCAVERTLRDNVASLYGGELPRSAHSISSILKVWENAMRERQDSLPLCGLLVSSLCAQLRQLLNIRNGVCHGLRGISGSDANQSGSVTWELNGEEHSVSWEELQTSFAWLSKVPFAVEIISRSRPEMMIDTPGTRAWWESEYGLSSSIGHTARQSVPITRRLERLKKGGSENAEKIVRLLAAHGEGLAPRSA